ncbi:UDP-N-acetylmuramoyl-L-alanyl-D-glutamate--2,6-diaminopimelate ligase [Sporosarcina sp. GW1-11]|uniref:UDP-N-acetylmuramoyl-L-alanyl-D-glutamate--2, 6-diaminopimelate ligase n=1 Tax=Sporosarcina sp. GW1-11 TaxID=2899126 RepID=UPI00294EA6F4|nr:UDP-N-acetylmuramoyl-L-alanyl-D-glutamate--2,6-diaminopimelate ligase [Sporosarcina sp. GW1-11]MDV6376824.1 UDP-N-acetylmuramoyl-L-alanyl-D-glutamate--2,6-diaminopimelate ligase [Sporosarcina sp. GW1-11]
MLLSELIKEWPCTVLQGSIRQAINGVTESSTRVRKGYVFVARKGRVQDGMQFIEEALEKGANTIVTDRTSIDLSRIPKEITVLVIPDSSLFISYASAKLSSNPGEELTIIAVTGTNGKTTVSHFIGQMLRAAGLRVAVIGTTGIYINGKFIASIEDSMTTMPAEKLHPLLRDCVDRHVTHVILEASSLGLCANRLAHCPIAIGILLNVGIDHYEEHGGKQQYINAKKQLFLLAEKMIVNEDDLLCYEIGKEMDVSPMYFGNDHVNGEQGKLAIHVPGNHNNLNARAACCALMALGYPFYEIQQHVSALHLPTGRMEKYSQYGIDVYVDYAHTPDALQVVLEALREEGKNVCTVFGCGGDRDHEKRPQMGAVAAHYSTHVILTSDNPRSEEPAQIILDILSGTSGFPTPIDVLINRKYAIQYAIRKAQYGDIILVAGKGHEQTQHIGENILPFCDMEEVKQAFIYRNLHDEKS